MGRKRKSRASVQHAGIEGPAKDVPGVVLVLESLSPKLGGDGSTHYRNVSHPLDLALQRGKISDAQWAAGDHFRQLYMARERSGVDSTQGSSGGSSGTPWTQAQVDAIRRIEKLEAQLSENDRAIVRGFCGEGWSMVDALRRSGARYSAHGVLARIQEALDSLGKAVISVRKKNCVTIS